MKSLKQFLYTILITSILTGLSFQPARAETPQQPTLSLNIAPLPALIGGNWYVSTTGSDANDCATPSTPCATINGAIGKGAAGNTILVATGIYTGSGTEVVLVNKSITLSGGWDATFSSQVDYSTIDGQNARQGVNVNSSNVIASLDRFIISNGYSNKGGGVYSAGSLTITNSSIQNNSAAAASFCSSCYYGSGGGIYNNGGDLTLTNTTLSNNSASASTGNGGVGGGIANVNGTLTLTNTTISNNSSNAVDAFGGGIYNGGSLTVNNSTVGHNSAEFGGGIYQSNGNLTLNDTTISHNSASGFYPSEGNGGGIYNNSGNMTMTTTTLSDNSASRGGGISNGGNLTVNNSTLSNNSASGGGGGIINGGTLTVANSTISDNSASNGDGGGINNGGNLTVNNSTVSNNSARWTGGGIEAYYGSLSISNSILGGNTAQVRGPDCYGTLTSSGNNIIRNTSDCTINTVDGYDQLNVDPKLGPLADNGGPTQTMALLEGSPAIDAGNPAICLPADQRGVARVGICDSGAYEYPVLTGSVPNSLYVVSGSDQRTPPSLAFAKPLQVVALDSLGSPAPNITVTFTAPATGASGTFADTGTNTTSALTDANGVATAASFTANAEFGSYQISASASGLTSAAFNLQNGAWYVSLIGDDANSCFSSASPCLTINGAISKAARGDTMFVAVGTYTGSGAEVVLMHKSLTLSGGWDATFSSQVSYSIIDGQNARRGVTVNGGLITSLDRFIIRNGYINGDGGGVYNSGHLTITNSSIYNNAATSSGGGIYNPYGGSYDYYGSLILNNTTVSNNTAAGGIGGGINNGGNLELNNSTISNNFALRGGGIVTHDPIGSISNSILGGNTALYSNPDCDGPLTSSGHNIISNTSGCTITAAAGDQFNVDPKLGTFLPELGYQPLLLGSPAIDAGNPDTCLPTDQHGVARPQGSKCDIGAYEYVVPGPATRLLVVSGNNQHTLPLQVFSRPLQVVALDSQGIPVPNVMVTFTAPASGASGTFLASGTNTASALTNDGGVATTSTFTANAAMGVYQVSASASGLAPIHFNLQNAFAIYTSPSGDDTNPCTLPAAPCRTINGAIGKAASGDLILIAAGTYTGSGAEVVLVNKSITLLGGWDATFSSQNDYSIVDGQNARRGVTVTSAFTDVTASLDRFIVRNGSSSGISNGEILAITRSFIQNNVGRGIVNGGTLTVTNTTISNNSGGGISNSKTLTLSNSTLSNNTASQGGGIYNSYGTSNLNNSTLSNNSATSGGGIYNADHMTLNNTTVSNNSASASGGGIYAGIGEFYYAVTNISNSILSGNTAILSGPDCEDGFDTFTIFSNGHNLISNTSGCSITASSGDQFNMDPMLGPLSDNGGPTQTMALLSGSPAINAGNPATCPTTDQRGAARMGVCDIGAYEFNGTPTIFTISGNTGVGGVTLSYTDGTPKTVTSNGSGNYTITIPSSWSGIVTPSKIGYVFSPGSRNYSNVTTTYSAQDYTATYTTHDITGNAGVAGVTMSYMDGTLKTVISDESGNYSITLPHGWTGAVTPSLSTDAFCPASQSYNNLTTNKISQNYAHAPCPNFGTIGKWTSSFDLSHGWTVKDYVRTVGDVYGDNDADLVGFGLDGVYVALSNGTSFDAVSKWTSAFDLSHGWTVASYIRTVGDVNGDSKADLVGFGLDGVYVALSNGISFDAVGKWTSAFDLSHGWTVASYVRTVGDVNGDSNADLVGFGLDGVYVALSNGTSFDAVGKWTSAFDLSHGWTAKDYVRTVGDVNGDGNADLVGFGLDGVYVALSNGTSFDAVNKWTSGFALANGWTVKDYVRTVGDVNNDGKADIVGFGQDGVYIGLSTGSTFSLGSRRTTSFDLSHGWTVAQYVRTVGDVNGDGKDDLVGFGLDGVYVVPAQ